MENRKFTILLDNSNSNGYFVNVPLFRTAHVIDYINTADDRQIYTVERQNNNPYFLEYGFFDGILRNQINHGSDLTSGMINFIRLVRPDIGTLFTYDEDVQNWFEQIGQYELPWQNVMLSGSTTTITITDIETSDFTVNSIISKANFYPITINS